MAINNYYFKARLFPTVLTSIPAIIFYNKFVASLYHDKLENIFSALPTITDVIFSSAIIFLLVQINRFLSKEIFQRLYFQDELKMPTTNHLLWSDTFFEKTIKDKIRSKILSKFKIQIQNVSKEQADELTSRKQIVAAVSQIRNVLRDNKLLLQHNIEYGFFRNLIGGAVIALPFSIAIFIYGIIIAEQDLKIIGITLVFIYLIPLIFSKPIIKRFGSYYSKILYEQFLSI